MSGELVDRINELLLQIAAMEFDINSLKAEVMHQRAKAEAYEAVLEGTHGEGVDKGE